MVACTPLSLPPDGNVKSSLMATCHNDLRNPHTAPAGLRTRDIGERSPTPQAGSSPLQSRLGHTQSKPLSVAPTSETALFSSPRARPDLAPDSWRSGTRTPTRQRGKRRGASSPARQLGQRSGRTRLPERGSRHRTEPEPRGCPGGMSPATHRGAAVTRAKAAVGQPPTPGTPRRSVGGMRLLPERGTHLCFMLLCPRGRRGHPAARRDTQPQPPRASPQRPARQQRRRRRQRQERRRRGGAGTWEGGGCGPPG